MLTKLADGAIALVLSAIKVVALVVFLIALVAWAKADPESAQALLAKLMDAAAACITWASDQVISWTS